MCVARVENRMVVVFDLEVCRVTLGYADRQGDLLDDVTRFCDESLPETSIFSVLHRERDALYPDEMFADLYERTGRRSVPPSVVATVMVLQRLAGLSDREAVERYTYDARWRYACGVGGYDGTGWDSFAHTVLVEMRARLARSARPQRSFEGSREAGAQAGVGFDPVVRLGGHDGHDHVGPVGDPWSAARCRCGPGGTVAGGVDQRGRLRQYRQAGYRLGRCGRAGASDRLTGP